MSWDVQRKSLRIGWGVPVQSFSYTFGFPEENKDYVRYLEDLLRSLGYELGVSTIIGRAGSKSQSILFAPPSCQQFR